MTQEFDFLDFEDDEFFTLSDDEDSAALSPAQPPDPLECEILPPSPPRTSKPRRPSQILIDQIKRSSSESPPVGKEQILLLEQSRTSAESPSQSKRKSLHRRTNAMRSPIKNPLELDKRLKSAFYP